MKKVTLSLTFNRNNKLDKNGTAPVALRIYFPKTGKRKFIDTGHKLKPRLRDKKKQSPTKDYPLLLAFDQHVRTLRNKIEQYEYRLLEKGETLTPNHIDDILNKNDNLEPPFKELYTEVFKKMNLNAKITRNLQHHMLLLLEFKPDINTDGLSYECAEQFDHFLQSKHRHKKSTREIVHGSIRRFIKEAPKHGINIKTHPSPYSDFRLKKPPSNRQALNTEQLQAVEKLNISDKEKALLEVRDMFLFSCYTGLRLCDTKSLVQKEIYEENGYKYIRKKMQKVSRTVTLNISILFDGKALSIIQKYKNLFCSYSDSTVNKYMKVIAISAGIDMLLTYHISRHTFGTMLAEKTQNPYLIKELPGHADIQTSMIYIHYSQSRIDEQLKTVKWS